MRSFGFIGVLVTLVVALVAGVIGYNLGLGANIAANGSAVVYPAWGWGFGFGFPFFGLIFGILFLFLIFGLLRRAAWGGHRSGYGGGPGGWQYDGHDRFERWHRQAHGDSEPTDSSS
jgi:hypothetical protein